MNLYIFRIRVPFIHTEYRYVVMCVSIYSSFENGFLAVYTAVPLLWYVKSGCWTLSC